MTRIDKEMVTRGFAPSRERAKELIDKGLVKVWGKVCNKPSFEISADEEIEVLENQVLKYVSRGGLKIEKAISEFKIDLKDKLAADIGASTGGFSDCLLKFGARKVYAIDVGHDQLHESLRANSKVVNIEGINARYIEKDIISEQVDFISIDVSFISLSLVIPQVVKLLKDKGSVVALVKPQFEAGRKMIGRNGIVKDEKARQAALDNICQLIEALGFDIKGKIKSPIIGGDGNIEYLIYFTKQ